MASSISPAKARTMASAEQVPKAPTKVPTKPNKDDHSCKIDCRLGRVLALFNEGKLEVAQTMAEDLLLCHPGLTLFHRAPLHAMLSLYPFGIEHGERAVRCYKQIADKFPEFEPAYQNARETLAKANKIEALWEAQELKMEKRKTYTKEQVRHERYQLFYYNVLKNTRKDEFNELVHHVEKKPHITTPKTRVSRKDVDDWMEWVKEEGHEDTRLAGTSTGPPEINLLCEDRASQCNIDRDLLNNLTISEKESEATVDTRTSTTVLTKSTSCSHDIDLLMDDKAMKDQPKEKKGGRAKGKRSVHREGRILLLPEVEDTDLRGLNHMPRSGP